MDYKVITLGTVEPHFLSDYFQWILSILNGKVYVDYRIKTSYSIIGLYTATNFITLSALPWVLPGDILKALAKIISEENYGFELVIPSVTLYQ